MIVQAGVGSPENAEQLIIALEPEAAAIFCQEKNMNDFQAETGSRSVDGILSQLNTHYIVVDIGGKLYLSNGYKHVIKLRKNTVTSGKNDSGLHHFTTIGI